MNPKKSYFYKFSKLKWKLICDFFENKETNISFHIKSLSDSIENQLDKNSTIYFWGKKIDKELQKYAKENNIKINYIEDGFIRSFGLGSSLSKPLSLVFDTRGIYFDPTSQSDLEYILKTHHFTKDEIKRSTKIIKLIKELKISKYNHQFSKKITINKKPKQKTILIPGQVDDDMSVKFGAPDMSNMKLIKKVKEQRPNDHLTYKPHPDVLSGNRKGNLETQEVLKYVDQIVTDVDIDTMINLSDEVHTMTSLAGFDALIRDKKVFTYGLPFYAGWGLTNDTIQCNRRDRSLTIQEMAVAVYILYPKYLNPYTKKLTTPEEVISIIIKDKEKYQNNILFRYYKDILGYTLPKIRNFIKNLRGL
ncbi:MAG: capsule biosynthesis protein [Campylobacterota bacterium]|nr:capsule biosynthesis protein [Campylobacterota bacterium]